MMISYLSGNGIRCPSIVIVIEYCRIARVTIVSQSSSLQAPKLADDTISGLLSPKLTRAPFISPSGEFQLLLSQPRQTNDNERNGLSYHKFFDVFLLSMSCIKIKKTKIILNIS